MKLFKTLLLTLLIALLTPAALADTFVAETPDTSFTEEQARAFAVGFFCEKCGLDEESLQNAEWTVQFGHSSVEIAAESHWSITIRIKGHGGLHYVELAPAGDVIRWAGHGAEYTVADPELLDGATLAEPLPSDVQEGAVLRLVMEELAAQDVPGIEAHFVFSPHFNSGNIPVWLVRGKDAQGQEWKAAVSHKGELLSLTPMQQDFLCYTTPGEDFWSVTFPGERYVEEQELLTAVLECCIPLEERAAHTARWRTLVEAWMAGHPYYLNAPGIEYAVTIQSVYGVPDDQAIPQEQAEEAAFAHLTALSGGEAYLPDRTVRTDYFITDPQRPQWCIRVGRALTLSQEDRQTPPEAMNRYIIYVDAYSGEVISCEEY